MTPRSLLIATLVLFSIGSLGLNGALLIQLDSAFKKLQLSRIFPIGRPLSNANTAADTGADASAPGLLFVGDSRAEMWAKYLSAQGKYEVRNFAVGGSTSAQLLLTLDQLPVKYAIVIMQTGVNDLHPLGGLSDYKDDAVRQLQSNLTHIVASLASKAQTLVITSIFPAGPVPLARRHYWDEHTPELIVRLNSHLATIAGRFDNVLWLDTHALLVAEQGNAIDPRYLDPAFYLHVNPRAHARLTQALLELIAPERLLPPAPVAK